MKNLKLVHEELTKNGIDWELGIDSGWNENTLIFDGGDCKILLYVDKDEKNKLDLCFYDLFEEGEYNYITDEENEETTTSHRGNSKTVKKMLKELDLI